MKKSNPEKQEGSGRSLIEDIYQINYISLGEGAATCQVCGSPLREGDGVVVYVFQPAGSVQYQVGYVVCGDGEHERPEVFTLGVRELVVESRVGWCSDGAVQSSWPVLLDPEVVAVSAAATTSARSMSDTGGTAASAVSEVDADAMPDESLMSPGKVSVGEARRRGEQSGGAVGRGLFWGEQR